MAINLWADTWSALSSAGALMVSTARLEGQPLTDGQRARIDWELEKYAPCYNEVAGSRLLANAEMIRQWVAKGRNAKMNEFLENLSKGASQLSQTAGLGTKSVIIDSQTAIALGKDAKGLPLQTGEQAMVKYVKDLPEGTELHVGNVSIGEVGVDAIKLKGLPLGVSRDSALYKNLVSELETLGVGGSKGAADHALVADAFFAKSDAGLVPQFATADKNVFNKLAKKASPAIDPAKLGGKKLSELYPNGFVVEVAGQKLRVIPIQN